MINNRIIDKWIYGMRRVMNDNGINESDFSDDDILEILMGLYIPALPEENRQTFDKVGTEFWGKMYFKAIISCTKPQGDHFEGIDMELLRAKLNQN